MSTQVGNFPQNDRILLQHCSITCMDACFSRTSPTSSYIMICSSSVHDCKVHSSESISFTFRCCWQHLVLMSSTSTSIRFVFQLASLFSIFCCIQCQRQPCWRLVMPCLMRWPTPVTWRLFFFWYNLWRWSTSCKSCSQLGWDCSIVAQKFMEMLKCSWKSKKLPRSA